MRTIHYHNTRLTMASLLAIVLGAYLYSGNAQAGDFTRDIDRVFGNTHIEQDQSVGNIDSVNGGIRLSNGASARSLATVNGTIVLKDNVTIASGETVNGAIRAGENLQVRNSLKTVNGSIRINEGSTIGKDLRTVNGSIVLRQTTVGEDIITTNGNIVLRDGTVIEGDIIVRDSRRWWNGLFGGHSKPEITIDGNSVVLGTIHLHREVRLNIDDDADIGEIIEHY